jgi:hypothetical protein
MKVQVLPQGWVARCIEHGALTGRDGFSRRKTGLE